MSLLLVMEFKSTQKNNLTREKYVCIKGADTATSAINTTNTTPQNEEQD